MIYLISIRLFGHPVTQAHNNRLLLPFLCRWERQTQGVCIYHSGALARDSRWSLTSQLDRRNGSPAAVLSTRLTVSLLQKVRRRVIMTESRVAIRYDISSKVLRSLCWTSLVLFVGQIICHNLGIMKITWGNVISPSNVKTGPPPTQFTTDFIIHSHKKQLQHTGDLSHALFTVYYRLHEFPYLRANARLRYRLSYGQKHDCQFPQEVYDAQGKASVLRVCGSVSFNTVWLIRLFISVLYCHTE